jgi:hypothetical protein
VHATGLRLSLGLGLALVFVHLRYGIANNGFLVGWVVVRMMCGQRESGLTGVNVDQGHTADVIRFWVVGDGLLLLYGIEGERGF